MRMVTEENDGKYQHADKLKMITFSNADLPPALCCSQDGDSDGRITVMVADDHPLVRRGLSALIRGRKDMMVVAECSSAQETIDKHFECGPQVTLLGFRSSADSIAQTIFAIRRHDPASQFIVVTFSDAEEILHQAFRAGACGYLLTDAPLKDLFAAVQRVATGRTWITAALKYVLSKRVLEQETAFGDGKRQVSGLPTGGSRH